MLQQNSSPPSPTQPNPHTCIPQIPLSSHAIPMIASMMPQIPLPCLPAFLPSCLSLFISICLPCLSVCHTETASWENLTQQRTANPRSFFERRDERDAMSMMLAFPSKCGHGIAMQCGDCPSLCACVFVLMRVGRRV